MNATDLSRSSTTPVSNGSRKFASTRRMPRAVLCLAAGLPLVQAGGPKVNTFELREDFYDLDAVRWRLNGVFSTAHVTGEPYATWL